MVSAKLVHQIEDHWEAVSQRLLRLIRTSRGLPALGRMPESELTEACRRILRNLGHWLLSSSEEEIAIVYESVAKQRRREGIPLSEAIRGMQLMKEATLAYLRDEGAAETTVDLFAEEEFELQLGRFFDLLVYHLARGYEQPEHAAAHR
jgi:hypothetical protein